MRTLKQFSIVNSCILAILSIPLNKMGSQNSYTCSLVITPSIFSLLSSVLQKLYAQFRPAAKKTGRFKKDLRPAWTFCIKENSFLDQERKFLLSLIHSGIFKRKNTPPSPSPPRLKITVSTVVCSISLAESVYKAQSFTFVIEVTLGQMQKLGLK